MVSERAKHSSVGDSVMRAIHELNSFGTHLEYDILLLVDCIAIATMVVFA